MTLDLKSYIEENSTPIPFSGCWLWDRTIDLTTYCVVGNTKELPVDYAHRISYRAFKGQIGPREEVHHSCKIKGCVNPAHLHTIDKSEHRRLHIAQKEAKRFCINGHEMTPENTQIVHQGKHKQCRICNVAATKRKRDPLWREMKELAALERLLR